MAGVTIYRGDTVTLPVNVPSNAFTDLTGAKAFMTVKTREDVLADTTDDSNAVIQSTVTLNSNVTTWNFSLSSTDTNVTPGVYVWDIQIVTADNQVTTLKLKDNTFTVLADITRRTV